ncbi:unknown [Mycoplasma sp. CAG:611]|nr:unknown [Mycoplasma sp. CAG:611]
MIGNTKYYLGGYNRPLQIQKDVMYQYERKIKNTTSNEFYYGTNPNNLVGKLGLMYASDYGYAASDTCTSNLSSYNDETCTSNNWLYNIKKNEWLLPQRSNYSGDVFNIDADGLVGFNSASNNNYAVRPTLYLKYNVQISSGDGTSSNPYKFTLDKNEDNSNANKPVLASNMIPVYYDETSSSWKKADINNKTMENRWYNYDNQIWANAVTITTDRLETYKNENPGTVIPMDDITTMWVWIPRFNAVTPSNYNGGTVALPNAIDVTFVKENETAIDAFTFGDKELSGFWYGKFETSTTDGKLGCTTTTCSNANNILIKPNLVSVTVNNVSSYFYAGRSMEQPNNSFGFVSSEVDTHMSKNNEWGAVAYLTQSIYGRCTNSTTCSEVGINNNSGYLTGYGAPAGSSSSVANGAYNTTLGKNASTTGTIYGIYDMNGGAVEYVMGVLADTNGKPRSGYNSSYNSGFTGMLNDGTTYTGIAFPDSKYYNLYTGSSYTGHALTETAGWYSDFAGFVFTGSSWFFRGDKVYMEDVLIVRHVLI